MNPAIFLTCVLAYVLTIHYAISGTPADTAKIISPVKLETASGTIYGTLLVPAAKNNMPLVIFIAGSGPTDRDGNSPGAKNNSLKLLAEALNDNGIATLRYDKRGIGGSKEAFKAEKDLRFEHYIDDAAAWIALFKNDKRFGRVIIAGHSEGSLIGMIAANNAHASAFISIAGAGQPAATILRTQLQKQLGGFMQTVNPIIDSLAAGETVTSVPQGLNAIFRPSIQPYLISWFRYDPATEIKKLAMPTLIIQGTTDIQVSTEDANALATACPQAKLVIIEGMNHILKEASADRQQNLATYINSTLPITTRLVQEISLFINALK